MAYNLKANSAAHMRMQISQIKQRCQKKGYKVSIIENLTYGFGKYGHVRMILQKGNETKEQVINIEKMWIKTAYDLFYAENPREVRRIHKHGGTDDF